MGVTLASFNSLWHVLRLYLCSICICVCGECHCCGVQQEVEMPSCTALKAAGTLQQALHGCCGFGRRCTGSKQLLPHACCSYNAPASVWMVTLSTQLSCMCGSWIFLIKSWGVVSRQGLGRIKWACGLLMYCPMYPWLLHHTSFAACLLCLEAVLKCMLLAVESASSVRMVATAATA